MVVPMVDPYKPKRVIDRASGKGKGKDNCNRPYDEGRTWHSWQAINADWNHGREIVYCKGCGREREFFNNIWWLVNDGEPGLQVLVR